MLNVIDWPGYGCPVRKYTNKKVCYRTRTSVQLPRATTLGVSHQADSRRARLFEGKQLITSVIARAPNFVTKYSTGKLPMHVRLSGSVVVTVSGLPARFMLWFVYKQPRCSL